MAVGKNDLITALDIGSTKVCCFIARPDGAGGGEILIKTPGVAADQHGPRMPVPVRRRRGVAGKGLGRLPEEPPRGLGRYQSP